MFEIMIIWDVGARVFMTYYLVWYEIVIDTYVHIRHLVISQSWILHISISFMIIMQGGVCTYVMYQKLSKIWSAALHP